jgi:FMN-dependent NADH-azoreductase
MPKTLLQVDSSLLGDASVSRALSSEFVRNWELAHPGGIVITRDTTATSIPPLTGAWVQAGHTPEASLTAEQRELLALSDTLVAELFAADEWVFGVPMYNFSIPSTLKLWIDQVVRVNKTFSYATGAPVGVFAGKKATILTAAGANYEPGTAYAAYDFAAPYLRTVLGFLGVQDVTVISAGGAAVLRNGGDRQAFLQPHVESIRAQFQPA